MEVLGLALAVVAIVFTFEAPRRKFLSLFSSVSALPVASAVGDTANSGPVPPVYGATQSGREPFFIREPYSTIGSAQLAARETGNPIFLVIYDQDHPSLSKLYYSLGCFMDYFTTKKLVNDHFVTALVPALSSEAKQLVPDTDPLECALWVVLKPNGDIIRRESVYANADEGLKRVREVIAGLANA